VSFLDEKGAPRIVEKVWIRPPVSRLGPITAEERQAVLAGSPVAGVYDKTVDRDSAYEVLKGKAEQASVAAQQAIEDERRQDEQAKLEKEQARTQAQQEKEFEKSQRQMARTRRTYDNDVYRSTPRRTSRSSDSVFEAAAKSAVRGASSQLGRQLVRGILGSLLRG
jgi:hypothetical protein